MFSNFLEYFQCNSALKILRADYIHYFMKINTNAISKQIFCSAELLSAALQRPHKIVMYFFLHLTFKYSPSSYLVTLFI